MRFEQNLIKSNNPEELQRFICYEVGKPFKEGKTNYKEGTRFDFTPTGAELVVYIKNLTPNEIISVRKGQVRVGYSMLGEVIFLLFKFGDMAWMDAPFSIHLASGDINQYEADLDRNRNMGYKVVVYLVDASTGVLMGMRLFGLSNEFSRSIKRAIAKQREMPFNKAVFQKNLEALCRKFSTKAFVQMKDEYCLISRP